MCAASRKPAWARPPSTTSPTTPRRSAAPMTRESRTQFFGRSTSRLSRPLLPRRMSPWSATTTTVPSATGGGDLVMPGPYGPWGEHLVAAVRAGRVPESDIDDKVVRLLALARRVGALNGAVEGGALHEVAAAPRALV